MEFLNPDTAGRGWKGVLLALLLLFCVPVSALHAETQEEREYAVKAVFLFNFCQFIDWPSGSFANDRAPIVIGVLGSNPFGTLLNETVQGEMIRGRAIQLVYLQRPQDALNCHILFVTDDAAARYPDVANTFRGRSVVTVGESESFLTLGGMIALPSVQNKIRLQINLGVVRAAKVEMSSKLLRVADVKR